MNLEETIRLVRSLTSAEKRSFKIMAASHGTYKYYIDLYDLIERSPADTALIRVAFRNSYPGISLPQTTQYLGKVLLESLVETRKEKDPFFRLMQGILESRVLEERSLDQEATARLRKIRQTAVASENHWIEYYTYRKELDQLTDGDFPDLADSELISLQMRAKEVLKNMNHIQDHHSLFELLKYRLLHSGKITSDNDKKTMHDLMLSEMTLVTGRSRKTFLSQKLHLLFQSFFFINAGDYQTALKTFRSLDDLFGKNLKLLSFPPIDYLSALTGIIDSLYSLSKFDEIDFYFQKAILLDKEEYPEYFRMQVRKMIAVSKLSILIATKQYTAAVDYLKDLDESLLEVYNLISEEKQWELFFYCSLAHFHLQNWKKAHHYIMRIMQHEKAKPQLVICRMTRLLNIIIYYEKRESTYLSYEIRSYKRFIAGDTKMYRSERLLLWLMARCPDKKEIRLNQNEIKRMKEDLQAIRQDKYETQVLRYFDIVEWIVKTVNKKQKLDTWIDSSTVH